MRRCAPWRPWFAPRALRWLPVIPALVKLPYPACGLGVRLWIYTRWKSICFDALVYLKEPTLNIFAYTDTTAPQPPYISINERVGMVQISVRGITSPHVAHMYVPDDELAAMAAKITSYLNAKQGGA